MFNLCNYPCKLSDNQDEYNLIEKLLEYYKSELKLTPCFGVELEFYIHGNVDINTLEKKLDHKIKPEKGNNQYEVNLAPSQDIIKYIDYIKRIRKNIIHYTKDLNGIADFGSKLFANDYGSSMHVHLNFLEDNDVENYAKILCHFLPDTIDAYLPNKEDYKRLDSKFMAPTHISYGGNNRSVVIRIPDSRPLRLEHRLAAADAEPAKVIYAMLHSIALGLENINTIIPVEKTFGNASDEQYGLKKIEFMPK